MEKTKTERLQWILDDAVARGEIPGATLLVRKDGKEEVYLESGYADIEAKKPVARDSIYRLYSMSKPITAVAVMLLAERGQIDLADPVYRNLNNHSIYICCIYLIHFNQAKLGTYQQRKN